MTAPHMPVREPSDGVCRTVAVWTRINPAGWPAEAYRRIYEHELLARAPNFRFRMCGDIADTSAAVTERGDVLTSPASVDGQPFADAIVAAAPDLADVEAIGRHADRQRPIGTLILSGLSVDGAQLESGAVARAIRSARYVSVRDEASLEALRGIQLRGAVSLIPDPLVLAARLTTPVVTRRRIEYLRAMDRHPMNETVLVELVPGRVEHLAELGRQVKDAIALGYRITVVAVPAPGEPMTGDMRHAVARFIEPALCFEGACFEDVMALVGSAVAIVPQTAALSAVARSFGRIPVRLADAASSSRKQSGHSTLREALEAAQVPAAPEIPRALETHFDQIASDVASGDVLAPADFAAGRTSELAAARQAAWRRQADERLRFAGRAEEWLAEIDRLQKETARLTVREAALRQEMSDASAYARHQALRTDDSQRRTFALDAENARLETAHAELSDAHAALAVALEASEHESASRADRIEGLSRERAELEREIERLHGAITRFARSRSWRYLAPARAVGQMLRRWAGVRQ